MSYLPSKLKTWLKRNGFRTEGKPRSPMRECNGYLERSGRKFRIRFDNAWRIIVDIGEPFETFDRWANSRERTISLDDFKKEFGK